MSFTNIMITTKIIKDSIAPSGIRLTTFVLTYPRIIHSELMTHRVFSRNASSSRAIPVKKQIEMVKNNPFIPSTFTKNQKGMQGGEGLQGEEYDKAYAIWTKAYLLAIECATQLEHLKVHKQYVNRILEPYSHITVILTSTSFTNFFTLRCHKDAQPEIRDLANDMYQTYKDSRPDVLKAGQWHLPFIDRDEEAKLNIEEVIKVSAARCARVSYLTHNGLKPSLEEDLALYGRLVGQTPLHASPTEHQAMAIGDPSVQSGNFKGWIQYRKTLPNENNDA